MKILIVNTFYYPNMVGGTEQSVKLLAEGLQKNGHEVVVLTGDRDDKETEVINNVKVIRADLNLGSTSKIKKITRKILEFRNIALKGYINKVLEEEKPDIVHSNNLFYISPIIWKCAKERDIKVVHTLRDYWGLCPKTTLLNSKGEICERQSPRCKLHTSNYKAFTKYVDVVTAPSKFTLDIYRNRGLFTGSKQQVVYNAIDFDTVSYKNILRNKLAKDESTVSFLFMGALDHYKGVKFLIDSFIEVHNENISLKICGDGPLRAYVEEKAVEDSRITYLGKVFKEEKEKVLLESDVMVVPSIWYEPFGRVVIEGYKYAMPVLGCEIGGIKELLNDGPSLGIVPKDINSLKNAIIRLSDRNMIKELLKTKELKLDKYDLQNQISSFEGLYRG